MANLQAGGAGNVYDPRLNQTERYWQAVQAEGKQRAAVKQQTNPNAKLYHQMRGRKIVPLSQFLGAPNPKKAPGSTNQIR